MNKFYVAVEQVEDLHGKPLPAPVRKGVFSSWEVARGYIRRYVGPYPITAFRAAQMVQDHPGGMWYVPGGAP